ncbi:Rof/RNase P-like protein [Elsinoe ampelina]|uniref:Rof/RNase P-like protein n=1 Tax=Elsinoe ampelina TaxID=302913 RepID=A0A6A6GM86_9PEZI|nr:Rof/RNase P-like protein [Elsinoe ampelina]
MERVSKGKKKLSPEFVGPMLSSADFHGAVVRVVRSGCVSRVGIRGIVVKDTKFTFEIVTKMDQVKVVPKEGTVFRVEVPVEGDALEETDDGKVRYVFEVYGEQLMTSAPDRANKKFKMHVDPGL